MSARWKVILFASPIFRLIKYFYNFKDWFLVAVCHGTRWVTSHLMSMPGFCHYYYYYVHVPDFSSRKEYQRFFYSIYNTSTVNTAKTVGWRKKYILHIYTHTQAQRLIWLYLNFWWKCVNWMSILLHLKKYIYIWMPRCCVYSMLCLLFIYYRLSDYLSCVDLRCKIQESFIVNLITYARLNMVHLEKHLKKDI